MSSLLLLPLPLRRPDHAPQARAARALLAPARVEGSTRALRPTTALIGGAR